LHPKALLCGPAIQTVLAAALLACGTGARAATPRELADPRKAGSCVAEWRRSLDAGTERELASTCREVAEKGAGDIVAVVIDHLDPPDPEDFARELFDHWHLGRRQHERGVLLLFHQDEVTAVLGTGLDAEAKRTSDDILAKHVRPQLTGFGRNQAVAAAIQSYANSLLLPRYGREHAEQHPAEHADEDANNPVPGCLGSAVLLVVGLLVFRAYRRRQPKPCPKCKRPMVRLGGTEKDQYLSDGARMEERLRTGYHDIWRCWPCDEVLRKRYNPLISRYQFCRGCGYRTALRKAEYVTTLLGSRETVLNRGCVLCGRADRIDQRLGPGDPDG
jgi:uncharacterized protein